jgi:CBS domain-containing membrane protein
MSRSFWRLSSYGQGNIPSIRWIIWSAIGGFLGILGAGWINQSMGLEPADRAWMIGSFGATAILLYGAPQAPFSQPRNLLGGHLLSALIGVSVVQLLPFSVDLLAAISVAAALVLMHLTNTLHPPGGASALIAVVGGDSIHELGYGYVLHPVLSGVLVMLVVALLINRLSQDSGRKYPQRWF